MICILNKEQRTLVITTNHIAAISIRWNQALQYKSTVLSVHFIPLTFLEVSLENSLEII